eukprot:1681022-Amphidinium_carterae.1
MSRCVEPFATSSRRSGTRDWAHVTISGPFQVGAYCRVQLGPFGIILFWHAAWTECAVEGEEARGRIYVTQGCQVSLIQAHTTMPETLDVKAGQDQK